MSEPSLWEALSGVQENVDAILRSRLAESLLAASFSDWDVGDGHMIEIPLDVAVNAVMKVLAQDKESTEEK